MQTEKSQPEGKQILPEKRFIKLLASSVGLRVGISRSASKTDVWLFFLTYDIKIIKIIRHLFIYGILCRITTI